MRWLNRLSLGQYTDQFLQHGYFDMMTIRAMDALDMEIVGVTDADHIQTLLAAIQKLKGTILKFFFVIVIDMQPDQVKQMETNDAPAEAPPRVHFTEDSHEKRSHDDDEVKINASISSKMVTRKGRRDRKGSMREDKRLPKGWKSLVAAMSTEGSDKTSPYLNFTEEFR
jgi:hypothetical protein